MIKLKMTGFNEFQRELKRLQRNAERINGENRIPFYHLFSNEFMKGHTKFSSIHEMFEQSPFTVETEEDFLAIDDQEWDEFIKTHSNFNSWAEMQEEAVLEWTTNQLGF
jgi:hypothetical protein